MNTHWIRLSAIRAAILRSGAIIYMLANRFRNFARTCPNVFFPFPPFFLSRHRTSAEDYSRTEIAIAAVRFARQRRRIRKAPFLVHRHCVIR